MCEDYTFRITTNYLRGQWVDTLRPRQNGRHFADDTFNRIFMNENVWILIKISMKFVPKGPINNIPALVQIMAWRRPGNKPLSEPMMVSLTMHICVTRPQWVNSLKSEQNGWVLQTTFSVYFLEQKLCYFFQFQMNLFLKVQFSTSHHWFR